MNFPRWVLIRIRQNLPNKVGFYKDCSFNIKGNEQTPVEVLLIESEIAMRCIGIDTIEGQFHSDRYYQLRNTCTTINTNNGRMERQYCSLFAKIFNYLVGSTPPDTILHLTGIHQSPMYEFGYVQHSLKKEFKSPNNLVLKKEHKTESSLYDHNMLELERQRIKRQYK
jgi:hypothetical protein